jgi:threonine synthase
MTTVLRCLRCARAYDPQPDAYLCPACGPGAEGADPGVLDVEYDYASVDAFPADAGSGSPSLQRWGALLPLDRSADDGDTLPVGGTPLVPAPRLAARLGLRALWLKDETRNPTRSLKDRATAVAVAMARRAGADAMYCASAGNAAISLAGFCAHAGLTAHAFVPQRASPARLAWLRRFGAHVHVVEGDYDTAFAEAERVGAEHGWYSRNCAFNPFLVEGKKTAAFEIAEALDWSAPDLVVAPVGDGCTLGGIGKGFRELAAVGRTDRAPQLVGVQADAIQPLVRRFGGGGDDEGELDGETAAASMAVRHPRNALRLLAELRHAGGTMLAVADDEMRAAQHRLATEAGVAAELTSAAGLAALERLAADGSLRGRSAVVVITGGRLDDDP